MPLDGRSDSRGLTAPEYAALVRDSNGNFHDDGVWWLKGAPRGEIHTSPLQLFTQNCEEVTYDQLGFSYSATTPPISGPPACARALAGMYAGLRRGNSWPQLLHVDGAGFLRVAVYDESPVFSGFARVAAGGNELRGSGQATHLTRIDILSLDPNRLEWAASLDEQDFSGALRATFMPGNPSRLSVKLALFPRAERSSNRLTIGAISAAFERGRTDTPEISSDEAHDADRLSVTWDSGVVTDYDLAGGELTWGDGEWLTTSLSDESGSVAALSLVQSERDPARYASDSSAHYESRPNVTISDIHSELPTRVRVSLTRDPAARGNVDAALVIDLTENGTQPVYVSYELAAALP